MRTIATHIILDAEAVNRAVKLEELDLWGGHISSAPEVKGSPYFQRDTVFSWHWKPRRGVNLPQTPSLDSEGLRIRASREGKVLQTKFPYSLQFNISFNFNFFTLKMLYCGNHGQYRNAKILDAKSRK